MVIVSVPHLFVLATNRGFILSCQLNGHKVKARNLLFAAKLTPKILEKRFFSIVQSTAHFQFTQVMATTFLTSLLSWHIGTRFVFHLLFLLPVWFFDYVFARLPSGSLAGLEAWESFSGGCWEGARPPLICRPNWDPKGRKKFFWRLPLLISGSGWPSPPLSIPIFFSGFGSFWESFLSGDIPGAQLLAVISKTIIFGEMRGVFIELLIRPFIREKISCGLLWPRLN